MARAHVREVLQNDDGSILTGVEVSIVDDADLTLLADALWTTETGTVTSLTNPFLCSTGEIEFYLDVPRRFRVSYSPPGGGTVYTVVDSSPDPTGLVLSSAPLQITNSPEPGDVLIGGSDGTSAAFGPVPIPDDAPTGAGEEPSKATSSFYMQDSGSNIWVVTIDTLGRIVTTAY